MFVHCGFSHVRTLAGFFTEEHLTFATTKASLARLSQTVVDTREGLAKAHAKPVDNPEREGNIAYYFEYLNRFQYAAQRPWMTDLEEIRTSIV